MSFTYFPGTNVIGQVQGGGIDGGDSASWNGIYNYLTDGKGVDMTYFEVGFGAYVRHPDPDPVTDTFEAYYKSPWDGNFTRDQMTGTVAGLGAQKNYGALIRLGLHWSLRGFLLAYNNRENGVDPAKGPWRFPDLTLLDMWALYIRMFPIAFLFRGVLNILDVMVLINTFIVTHITKEDEHVLNFLIKVITSVDRTKTLTSYLTSKIIDREQMDKALTKYWCNWRRNCGFVNLYRAKMKKVGIV